MAVKPALILAGLMIAAALPAGQAALDAQSPRLVIPAGKQFGFGFEAVPDGAKVTLIVPGSAAERAGLKLGMVVARLNGVPLGALDLTRLKEMFVGAPDEVTLRMLSGDWIKLRRAKISDSDRAAFEAKVNAQ